MLALILNPQSNFELIEVPDDKVLAKSQIDHSENICCAIFKEGGLETVHKRSIAECFYKEAQKLGLIISHMSTFFVKPQKED